MSTNEIKKQQFPNFLQADSMADKWYKDLIITDKVNWTAIEAAFHKRWLRKQQVKKTREEYEEEIALNIEDLGKKEKVAGRDVYSHIV